MGWWGKVVGGALGLVMGGPLGALLGGALGHGVDRGLDGLKGPAAADPGGRERIQSAFFTATFSVMGHLAKADGRVSEREIAVAEAAMTRMELSPAMRRTAIELFNRGKEPGFPLQQVLEQFRRECHRRRTLIQMFLEIQIQAAYADGPPDARKWSVVEDIGRGLGVPAFVLRRLDQFIRLQWELGAGTAWSGRAQGAGGGRAAPAKGPSLDQAYAVLGLHPEAPLAEVKRAYRRLLSQHHPDKLVSRGLPEEMMKLAAEKTHEIRQAYEVITRARAA
jgi:DnaJ like chaperone protein